MPKRNKYTWSKTAPAEDGDFFYSGKLPKSDEEIVCIVQIVTIPRGKRVGTVFLPPYWRGQMDRTEPSVYYGKLKEWDGEWAGPEFGLCTATYP
jgi:IS4 transposase